MNEEWFRQMLIDAHNNQRRHLKRIIGGLSEEHLTKVISPNERLESMQVLLWHIGSAETYWFYKSKHPIGQRYESDDLAVILKKLDENTDRIAEVINTCSIEQLRIVPPSPEDGHRPADNNIQIRPGKRADTCLAKPAIIERGCTCIIYICLKSFISISN